MKLPIVIALLCFMVTKDRTGIRAEDIATLAPFVYEAEDLMTDPPVERETEDPNVIRVRLTPVGAGKHPPVSLMHVLPDGRPVVVGSSAVEQAGDRLPGGSQEEVLQSFPGDDSLPFDEVVEEVIGEVDSRPAGRRSRFRGAPVADAVDGSAIVGAKKDGSDSTDSFSPTKTTTPAAAAAASSDTSPAAPTPPFAYSKDLFVNTATMPPPKLQGHVLFGLLYALSAFLLVAAIAACVIVVIAKRNKHHDTEEGIVRNQVVPVLVAVPGAGADWETSGSDSTSSHPLA